MQAAYHTGPHGEMAYSYHAPHTSIATYVRTVLAIEGHAHTGPNDLPLFTNGSPALFCRVRSGEAANIILYGQEVPATEWGTDDDTTLIAFFFKPFALNTVFGVSAAAMKDGPLALNQWNAHKAIAVNLHLQHAHTATDRVAALTNLVAQQITANAKDCHTIRHATDRMILCTEGDILATLLDELQLTERTFQRVFKKYVGTTPGQYRRICQFYFAFAQLRGGHFDKLTDVAYDNGYFDQSHYIRSFKEFAGITPAGYLQTGLPKE